MTLSPTNCLVNSIVIDSNVWISALVFGGDPRRVFERVVSKGLSIIVSAELLSEIRRTLTRKFPAFLDDFELLLVALRHNIDTVTLGSVTIKVCRDPDDDKVIETAVIGDASYIISDDKDLLVLQEFQEIIILSPNHWLL